MKLLSVDASCSCTTKSLSKVELAVGESAELRVGAPMPQSYDEATFICTIKTDHVNFPEWVYALHFTSVPRIQIAPSTLHLGRFRHADFDVNGRYISERLLPHFDITVDGKFKDAPQLGNSFITSESLNLHCSIASAWPSGFNSQPTPMSQFRLSIVPTLNSDYVTGNQLQTVIVELPDGSQSSSTITWRIDPSIVATPHHVHFGRLEPGQTSRSVKIILSSEQNNAFKVRSTEFVTDNSLCSINVNTNTSGDPASLQSLECVLAIAEGANEGITIGSLRVTTDVPSGGTLTIPWSAIVEAKSDGSDSPSNPALSRRK